MIIDGKAIAKGILAATRERVAALGLSREPIMRAVTMAPSPATRSYLSIKTVQAAESGFSMEVVTMEEGAKTTELVEAVRKDGADAVIVQLPLPDSVDTAVILNAIPRGKDADVLSEAAVAAFESGESKALVPPVAAAVTEILARASVDVRGKHAVVVGKGNLVGRPVAVLLSRMGADVRIVSKSTGDFEHEAPQADIIVSGAGVAGLVKPEHVKSGAVLIDAGTSGSGGGVVGDLDPACAAVASIFTPVPGGVGPIAVACLFRNAADLLETRF